MMEPETGYARLGQHHVAFEVMGDGPIDLLSTVGRVGSMEADWADPEAAAFLHSLASFCRLIRYDSLGTGSSDPVPLDALPPLELCLEEMLAVMDAVKSERAVLAGYGDGGHITMLAAATKPERVLGLILHHSPARFLWAEDYPDGLPEQAAEELASMPDSDFDRLMDFANPSRANDPVYAVRRQKFLRGVAGPSAWRAFLLDFLRRDVRSLLTAIHVPTLVLHKQDLQMIPIALGRFVADAIPGAKFVQLPGADVAPFWESPEVFLQILRDFVTSIGPGFSSHDRVDRVMATVLFTDIVSSTERAFASGDAAWTDLLDLHDSLSRRLVGDHLGRVVKMTGDGILARFDTPGRGILSATALRDQLARVGLPIRAGLHTGEVELRGEDLGGAGVHIAARVMAAAGPGEVLVSRTVRDLVVGSEFRFEDRGAHTLKGVEEDWQLFALAGI